MTRSNLHITLSNGEEIICVADSSSAPEQGYIVEEILSPLLALSNSKRELSLIKKHCTMDERRANASYRYYINLVTKTVTMFEENFNYRTERFRKGKDLTERYTSYVETLNVQDHEK
ncbi:penicillin-binding protein [Chryseobacterium sp. WG23]|uniref:penicillin-binding protein n=1 Tax=Chryseobacterium sp. WG23 TaxID=2926910 RepID=UPI00211EFD6C|nr:penicillin-binding protein [Chryseobacterium sp. WG23]MCQ9634130.1 penicillin-binding protein [Chryseobacterium sp. WG23]